MQQLSGINNSLVGDFNQYMILEGIKRLHMEIGMIDLHKHYNFTSDSEMGNKHKKSQNALIH